MIIEFKGASDECDLLVAAVDGSKSKIRTHVLPDEKLNFMSVIFIGVQTILFELSLLVKSARGLLLDGNGTSRVVAPLRGTTIIFGLSKLEPRPGDKTQEHLSLEMQRHFLTQHSHNFQKDN
jgi:hypothetical protein